MAPDTDSRLTVAEAAQVMSISARGVLDRIADGSLEAINIGRGVRPRWRIHASAITRYEAERSTRNE